VFVVAADMATRPAEYQQRWYHDHHRRHHVGASKFFGLG
jgi:hypothetical protein